MLSSSDTGTLPTLHATGTPRISVTRQSIAARLGEARARTLLLIQPLSEKDLRIQHDSLMSPVLWDLGHIAHFEELWLVRNLDGPVEYVEMPGLYDPFEHPRRERGALPIPSLNEILGSMRAIRERVLERLERVHLDDDHPLLRDGYVYSMVLQHEYQHTETILQTLQLKTGAPYAAKRAPPVRPATAVSIRPPGIGEMVRVADRVVDIGTCDRAAAYDNERPRHEMELSPFWMDVHPVTNAQYLEFMSVGGYDRREWWSDAGWRWLRETGVQSPAYWARDGNGWITRSMDRLAAVEADAPVRHVCYHEAEAFATFAGKRLPTELEWETAASWDASEESTQHKRTYPWGERLPTLSDANLDQLSFGTTPVGTYPAGRSPTGCWGMIGDVWEWTSSDFRGYPGFRSFPYKEYSEVFFGSEYKVLRGGSWATRPGAIRVTFRNWDYPIRRQMFAGFRCARDD